MSERFDVVDRVPFDIGERLNARELSQLEATIREEIEIREETLSDLQHQNLAVRAERDALQRRVGDIEQERLDLEQRIEELEAERLRFEPESVITDFGSALDAVVEQRRYAVTDFQVDLRTNVVSTDDGIRLQFPTPLEEVDARNLSTLTFGIGRRPDADVSDYRDVPAVEGLDRATAERRLEESGLAVGEIGTETAEQDDIVLEQFPEPYVLAEPETEVDLIVSVAPEPEPNEGEADDELRMIDGIGPRRAERLQAERIDDLRALLEADPQRIADIAGVSVEQAESWLMQARELR